MAFPVLVGPPGLRDIPLLVLFATIKKKGTNPIFKRKGKTLNNCFIKRHSAHATEHAHMVPHFLLHPNAIISFAYLRPYDCMPKPFKTHSIRATFRWPWTPSVPFSKSLYFGATAGEYITSGHISFVSLCYLAFHFQVQCQGCILYTVWIIYTIMMIIIWDE